MNSEAVDGDGVFTGACVTDITMGREAVDEDTIFASARVIGVGLEAIDGGIEAVVDEGVSRGVDDDERLLLLALEKSGMFSRDFNNGRP